MSKPQTNSLHGSRDQEAPIPVVNAASSDPEVVPGGAGYQQLYQQTWENGYKQSQSPHATGRICGVKRSAFWTLLTATVAIIIIAVLAGILGGVASGTIKTSGNSNSNPTATVTMTSNSDGTATSATSAPSVSTTTTSTTSGAVTIECPSANGLNYTAPGTSKTFKRECDVNYVGGEGDLGLQNSTFLNVEDCIDACASYSDCVGIVFNYQPQCWLKQYLGIKSSGGVQESAILIQ